MKNYWKRRPRINKLKIYSDSIKLINIERETSEQGCRTSEVAQNICERSSQRAEVCNLK